MDAFEPFLTSVNGAGINGAMVCSELTAVNIFLEVAAVVEKRERARGGGGGRRRER